ncbi:MAG: helix-turn-helix domain-containing GNAT family N-acetyltransferase [Sneathiellales bacterium]|nr:helix-turn-helix domain-containing GNAT family N-acetyltransferase [Sneathiellales bacterium]
MATIQEKRVARVREFSRFYTRKAGVLNEMLLDSNFGLTEARVMYELNNRTNPTAKELATDLDLDPAYISRLLKKIEKMGVIERRPAPHDGRQQMITLTEKGREEAQMLENRSMNLFGKLIGELTEKDQLSLLGAMEQITSLLDQETVLQKDQDDPAFLLRPHRPGDLGWIVSAHGRIYAEEYGWDDSFEALVASIASDFLNNYKEGREFCWIAEKNGETIGSAVVVEEDEITAKLRLVIVDPKARGLKAGLKLVEQCMRSAKKAGYEQMSLWTNDNLTAAINIYKKLGFELIEEEPHHSFGHDLVGQYWKRSL